MDLFEQQAKLSSKTASPLAEKMRPRNIGEFVGQDHIAGKEGIIKQAIDNDRIFSMILWGPPGCGKTTLAMIIASETRSYFTQISAVLSGVKQIREVIETSRSQLALYRKKTILFVDEIHRFNKAQQDAFLHHVESGLITLIGATTENPSFEVIPALLSRCRVVVLKPLPMECIVRILKNAIFDKERGLAHLGINFDIKALKLIAARADGDVRSALNSLEIAVDLKKGESIQSKDPAPGIYLGVGDVEKAIQQKALLYDKNGEEHYNLISAFHKSMRGSDPDAAVYWLTRMLEAGEDPLYLARRMVRFASEDVGNADPLAIRIALDAAEAFRFLGHPEGDLALVQSAVYLSTAPKSNSLYAAHNKARDVIEKTGALPVPLNVRNAPTRLMKELGYGENYKYSHDYKGAYVVQNYMPPELEEPLFYLPMERGYEKIIKERLDKWRGLKKNLEQEKT